jgi:hypothetical protein
MVERSIGEDDRIFEQSVRIDFGAQAGHHILLISGRLFHDPAGSSNRETGADIQPH